MGSPMVPTPMKPIRVMTLCHPPDARGSTFATVEFTSRPWPRASSCSCRPALRVSYTTRAMRRPRPHRARRDLVGHDRRDDDHARRGDAPGPLLVGWAASRSRRPASRGRRRGRAPLARGPAAGSPARRAVSRSSASPWPPTRSATSARSRSSASPRRAPRHLLRPAPDRGAGRALPRRAPDPARAAIARDGGGRHRAARGRPARTRRDRGPLRAGALLALGAGLSYAVYAVAAKRASGARRRRSPSPRSRSRSPRCSSRPRCSASARPRARWSAAGRSLLYLGIGPTAVAYVLFTVGLAPRARHRGGHRVACSSRSPRPRSASLVFGERLGAVGIAGALPLLLAALRAPDGPATARLVPRESASST